MKKLITTISFGIIASFAFAQSPLPVEISYDVAGNRTTRKVLEFPMMSKGSSNADSAYYLDQIQSIPVRVYPNPTYGKIYIEMQGEDNNAHNMIRLYDNQGRFIYEKEGLGNTMEIDISSYPTGCYMVELYANDERTTWKIVKK